MKSGFSTGLIFILSFFILLSFETYGKTKNKEIKILGTKIHTEEYLIKNTNLDNPGSENRLFPLASIRIAALYHKEGYLLARTHLVQETDDVLIIFVDEGRLGRIVFQRLNTFDTIKMKYEFNLKDRIYNKYTVEKEIARLKKKYKFKYIRPTLVPAAEGDKALFQLDDEIVIPKFGTFKLPFFNDFRSRYNLEILFIRQPGEKVKSIEYSIHTSYSKGLIPGIEYYYPSFYKRNDLFIIGSSMGIFYGLDLKFNEHPRMTFIEVHSDYHFAPVLRRYITPMASTSAYYSRASRPDIGLSKYNYLKLRGILAPGFTLLSKLRIYVGFGGERVYIYTPVIDEGSDYIADVEKHNDTWAVFESRLKFDIQPLSIIDTKKQFEIIYNYYINNKSFHELNLKCKGDIEFQNLNFYIFALEYSIIWLRPPFYHEYPVSGTGFKGFMGKSYYTRNILRSANEFKVSIYSDSFYAGLFTDLVRFKGSGYDLTGYQNGIVAGIAGHIIFLDQFEFNIFFGKDYLFSMKESQYNIFININKKW